MPDWNQWNESRYDLTAERVVESYMLRSVKTRSANRGIQFDFDGTVNANAIAFKKMFFAPEAQWTLAGASPPANLRRPFRTLIEYSFSSRL
jgi:hypothetical protein